MVQAHRTCIPSIPCKEGETRCTGCSCTSLGWFKRIELHRTFTNHIITEIARCVEVYHMSLGWLDCTEPSLCTLLQGKQRVQGAYATSSNLLTTHQLYQCVEFYHITKPLYLQQSRKFGVEVYHMSSGWFDCTKPSLCTLLQGEQGVQSAYA